MHNTSSLSEINKIDSDFVWQPIDFTKDSDSRAKVVEVLMSKDELDMLMDEASDEEPIVPAAEIATACNENHITDNFTAIHHESGPEDKTVGIPDTSEYVVCMQVADNENEHPILSAAVAPEPGQAFKVILDPTQQQGFIADLSISQKPYSGAKLPDQILRQLDLAVVAKSTHLPELDITDTILIDSLLELEAKSKGAKENWDVEESVVESTILEPICDSEVIVIMNELDKVPPAFLSDESDKENVFNKCLHSAKVLNALGISMFSDNSDNQLDSNANAIEKTFYLPVVLNQVETVNIVLNTEHRILPKVNSCDLLKDAQVPVCMAPEIDRTEVNRIDPVLQVPSTLNASNHQIALNDGSDTRDLLEVEDIFNILPSTLEVSYAELSIPLHTVADLQMQNAVLESIDNLSNKIDLDVEVVEEAYTVATKDALCIISPQPSVYEKCDKDSIVDLSTLDLTEQSSANNAPVEIVKTLDVEITDATVIPPTLYLNVASPTPCLNASNVVLDCTLPFNVHIELPTLVIQPAITDLRPAGVASLDVAKEVVMDILIDTESAQDITKIVVSDISTTDMKIAQDMSEPANEQTMQSEPVSGSMLSIIPAKNIEKVTYLRDWFLIKKSIFI